MTPFTPNSATYLSTSSAERITFFVGSGVTGLFGFFLGLAGLLSIKVTSPVSHMVSSAARSVLQTLLGVILFGEVVNQRRGMSIGVITAGALYYTWIQSSKASSSSASSASAAAAGANADFTKGSVIRHGHTKSLATLLPLYQPRTSPRRSASGGSSGSGSGDRSPSLGSISEEDEDAYFDEDRHERVRGLMSAFEEKRMMEELQRIPEDDRQRAIIVSEKV